MKIFNCPICGKSLFFGNLACACGAEVAFDPEGAQFVAGAMPCASRSEISCNWIADAPGRLCRSCTMTKVIPDTFYGENRALWSEAESAKRWVLATLARLGWFVQDDPGPRPIFHLLSEGTGTGAVPVSMGYAGGVVTINVTEADPIELVHRREALGERLRTMTGHFRHELGHFFFARLATHAGFLAEFRAGFGDERTDYNAALDAYYRNGPRAGWHVRHVTPYAACHPHEDWAESFTHLLHLMDIVDSYVAAGLGSPWLPMSDYDPYSEVDPERLVAIGVHLAIALNHVNRAMGLSDIYPTVLAPETREKLIFVHRWIRSAADRTSICDPDVRSAIRSDLSPERKFRQAALGGGIRFWRMPGVFTQPRPEADFDRPLIRRRFKVLEWGHARRRS